VIGAKSRTCGKLCRGARFARSSVVGLNQTQSHLIVGTAVNDFPAKTHLERAGGASTNLSDQAKLQGTWKATTVGGKRIRVRPGDERHLRALGQGKGPAELCDSALGGGFDSLKGEENGTSRAPRQLMRRSCRASTATCPTRKPASGSAETCGRWSGDDNAEPPDLPVRPAPGCALSALRCAVPALARPPRPAGGLTTRAAQPSG
jgi:hypothetical protein